MAPPYDPTNPRILTPQQRLNEVASLLATGARRLAAVRAVFAVPTPDQIPLEFTQNGLDVSPETRLHVPVVNAPESA